MVYPDPSVWISIRNIPMFCFEKDNFSELVFFYWDPLLHVEDSSDSLLQKEYQPSFTEIMAPTPFEAYHKTQK